MTTRAIWRLSVRWRLRRHTAKMSFACVDSIQFQRPSFSRTICLQRLVFPFAIFQMEREQWVLDVRNFFAVAEYRIGTALVLLGYRRHPTQRNDNPFLDCVFVSQLVHLITNLLEGQDKWRNQIAYGHEDDSVCIGDTVALEPYGLTRFALGVLACEDLLACERFRLGGGVFQDSCVVIWYCDDFGPACLSDSQSEKCCVAEFLHDMG